jgi:hypothetical protein
MDASSPRFDLMKHIERLRNNVRAVNNNEPVSDNGPRQNLLRIIKKKQNRICSDVVHRRIYIHSQTPETNSKKIKPSKASENKECEGASIEYEYDFGDCWKHQISLMGRADAMTIFKCFDG